MPLLGPLGGSGGFHLRKGFLREGKRKGGERDWCVALWDLCGRMSMVEITRNS